MLPTYIVTALALLVALGTTSVLGLFRPAGLRRRVVLSGLAMGVVPIAVWTLLVVHSSDASGVALAEALLVTGVSLFFTVSGCNWASIETAPSVVVARTIQFQTSTAGSIVIPVEYTTDPLLSVPQQATMYHLPRLQRVPARSGVWMSADN